MKISPIYDGGPHHHVHVLLQRMSFIRWPHVSQLKPFFLTVTDLAKVLFISRPPKMAIYVSSHLISSVCSTWVYATKNGHLCLSSVLNWERDDPSIIIIIIMYVPFEISLEDPTLYHVDNDDFYITFYKVLSLSL